MIVAVTGSLTAGLIVGYGAYRIWQRGEVDEARPADAIVVLGAAQYDGHPSPVFEARLEHAVALFRQGIAPILIVTGGGRAGDRTTEAAAARAWAERQGVPASAILGDDNARNTMESIASVAAILRQHGLRSAVFVSDRTHMLRVLRMAKDLGIDAYGSPATASPSDVTVGGRIETTLHELGAIFVYGLTGSGTAEQVVVGVPPSAANAASGALETRGGVATDPQGTPAGVADPKVPASSP